MSFFEKILLYQKRYRLVSHLLFWMAVMVVSISSSKYRDGREFTYQWALIGNGLFLIPQVIASYFLTYWVVPRFFFRKQYVLIFFTFFVGTYLICLLSRFLVVRIAEPLAGIPLKTSETNLDLMTDLPKLLYNYFFSIFSLAVVFLFVKLLKDQINIQKLKTETELKLLKTQLNPHFLFNTLNNIYALSLAGSEATSPAIAGLAEILDYMLYRCNTSYVPLSAEVGLLDNYIRLEQLRYGEKLKVDFHKHLGVDTEIAPLILLTLTENAFKHGNGTLVEIDLCSNKDVFSFCIKNGASKQPGPERIGLQNLRAQLELLYGSRFQLTSRYINYRYEANLRISR